MTFQNPESGGSNDLWLGGATRNVSADPESSETIQLIKSWVANCDGNHSECNTPKHESNVLPRRLIKVGQTEKDVQLIELKDSPLNPEARGIEFEYTALSHCWGQSQHLTTKVDTIEDRKQNIAWKDIPKTFQHAILVTRILGMKYIWIDSLCIVQDSASDWEHEAAKMGDIYNYAYIVIAASGSIDGDGGLLFSRPGYIAVNGNTSTKANSHSAESASGAETNWKIFVRKERKHNVFGWRSTSHQTDKYSGLQQADPSTYDAYPLFTRAWCYQERMLGKRILHFTRTEIVFECLRCLNCECGAMTDFVEDPMLEPRRLLNAPQMRMESPKSGMEDVNILKVWRHLAMEYSRKNITFVSDMLPALGGLATKWASLGGGGYFAGLWEEDFQRNLLWHADRPSSSDDEGPFIAPSWSWLQSPGSVTWIEQGSRLTKFYVDVDLKRTECVKKSAFEYGALSNGWMFMEGTLIRAVQSRVGLVTIEPVGEDNKQRRAQHFYEDSIVRCERYLQDQVWLLPFCTDITNDKTGEGFNRVLVLGSVEISLRDQQPMPVREWEGGVYQRLGVIEYFDRWEWDKERICDGKRTGFYLV